MKFPDCGVSWTGRNAGPGSNFRLKFPDCGVSCFFRNTTFFQKWPFLSILAVFFVFFNCFFRFFFFVSLKWRYVATPTQATVAVPKARAQIFQLQPLKMEKWREKLNRWESCVFKKKKKKNRNFSVFDLKMFGIDGNHAFLTQKNIRNRWESRVFDFYRKKMCSE